LKDETKGHVIDRAGLPRHYPTHAHEPAFWEALGRAVATFGFLEEVLLKAIFAITATTSCQEDKIESAYETWVLTLKRSLSDPLGNLIHTYGKAVRNNTKSKIENFDDLLEELGKASKIRNAICHGSWRTPDSEGLSIPFYVNKQNEIFDTPVGIAFLDQLRKATTDLACSVIDTVTHMGWQFPSSNGPGRVVWQKAGG
jgi:hypothetical protein